MWEIFSDGTESENFVFQSHRRGDRMSARQVIWELRARLEAILTLKEE